MKKKNYNFVETQQDSNQSSSERLQITPEEKAALKKRFLSGSGKGKRLTFYKSDDNQIFNDPVIIKAAAEEEERLAQISASEGKDLIIDPESIKEDIVERQVEVSQQIVNSKSKQNLDNKIIVVGDFIINKNKKINS